MEFNIARARAMAAKLCPFSTSLLLGLTPVKSDTSPPLSVDQHWRMYYNPQAIKDSEFTETDAAQHMLKACARLVQRHPERIQQMIPAKGDQAAYQGLAGMASEMVCQTLFYDALHAGIANGKLVDYDLVDAFATECKEANVEHMSLEQLFAALLNDMQSQHGKENANNQSDASSEGSGEANDGSDSQNRQPDDSHSPDELADAAQKEINASSTRRRAAAQAIQQFQSGSSVDGMRRPWEQPPPATSEDDHEFHNNLAFQAVKNVEETIADRGCDPGHALLDFMRDIKPHVSLAGVRLLKKLILEAVDRCSGYRDRRFDGRSRRQAAYSRVNQRQIIMPHDCGPVPQVAILVDTSGSMDAQQLNTALGFVGDVLRELQITTGIDVMLGDLELLKTEKIFHKEQLAEMDLVGAGGTHMGRCIRTSLKRLRKLRRDPNLVICLTDGYTPWELVPADVGVPFIVGITSYSAEYKTHRDTHWSEEDFPSFAHRVFLNPKDQI
jgi:hypothetical protein